MKIGNAENGWERTNVTNLLRNGQSGTYYARVKVNGKQKWKSLKTSLFSVAKLRLADFEAHVRAKGATEISEDAATAGEEASMTRFIAICRQRTENDSSLARATKTRRETAMKAIMKTWPDLASRDVRRVTPTDCQQWAIRALREGTGFVAPKAKTVRKGMSPGAVNKCIEVLSAVFEIARKQGIVYENPAKTVSKVPVRAKRLELPTNAQFQDLVAAITGAGSRASQDCADMVRLLAYSGARLAEATALQWHHVDQIKGQITVAGTKTESSYRTIPIIQPLAALLAEIRDRRGEALGVHAGDLRQLVERAGLQEHRMLAELRHLLRFRPFAGNRRCSIFIPYPARALPCSAGSGKARRRTCFPPSPSLPCACPLSASKTVVTPGR